MSDQHLESAAPVEPNFDRTPPQPFGDGPADPLVYDASPRALRQHTVTLRPNVSSTCAMSAGSTTPPPSGISAGVRL